MDLNKVYNENCLITMVDRIPGGSVNLVVTSPPYDNIRKYKGFSFPFKHIARHLYRIMAEGGVIVWIVGDQTVNGSETGTSFHQALFFMEVGFRLHDTMIYQKDSIPLSNHGRYDQSFEYMFVFSKGRPATFNPIMVKSIWGGHRTGGSQKDEDINKARRIHGVRRTIKDKKIKGNIWKYATGHNQNGSDKIASLHPAIFPEQLAADHISTWTNEGDLVYDPFSGSGTTAKMCHILKRPWIASEIAHAYIDIHDKRMKPYLAQSTLF